MGLGAARGGLLHWPEGELVGPASGRTQHGDWGLTPLALGCW